MATTTNSGQNYEIRNITLNSNTDVPIDFNQRVNSIVMRCRSSIDVYLRKTNGDSGYFTIPSGSSFALDVALIDEAEGGFIAGWARSASSTPVLEVIGAF